MWRKISIIFLLVVALLSLVSADPQALFNQGRYVDAAREAESISKSKPTDARNYFVWGNSIDAVVKSGAREAGFSFDEAMEKFRLAAKHGSGQLKAQAYVNLGVIQDRLGDTHGAIASHKAAIAANTNPNFYYPYVNLGLCYERLGRGLESLKMYEESFRRGMPKTTARELQFVTMLPFIYNSTEDLVFWRNRFVKGLDDMLARPQGALSINDPLGEITYRNAPGYYQLGYFGYNDAVNINKLAVILERAAPTLRYTSGHLIGDSAEKRTPQVKAQLQQAASGKRRIRVGFISAFLQRHASGQYIQGVITNLDRNRFEVITFHVREVYDRLANDVVSQRIRARADKSIDVPKESLASMYKKIENEDLDILVFCELGMDPGDYLLAFARLAPIQVATHGHASTSGIHDSLDYYVTYKPFEKDNAQEFYSEPLVTMKGLVQYYRPQLPATTATRQDIGLPLDKNVYLCVQTLYKITPDFDHVFAEILRRDPNGVIVFKTFRVPELNDLTLARFKRVMPDVVDRIIFLRGLNDVEWFSLFHIAEVMIDSYPFGGYTTSLEAFSMGLPIVTLPHDMLAGRCTMAFLQAMGVPELVAKNETDYIDIAVRVATDKDLRQNLSARILDNQPAIFDDMTAVRDWEGFFEEAVAGKKISNLHGTRDQMMKARWQDPKKAKASDEPEDKKKRRKRGGKNRDEL
eukprot:TRINITY_DN8035_c0_g1::TRINITY_DN8035_c0_g1_i1::g.20165::m.20165 TRINITY_DN8035_c0_g1::TRINITY_DN8035_c0_g1_i1::g.20165  ORF type:complete len:693 (-),score=193.62,sp/Q9M8Y0/SEC_ARATH/27.88/1e-24,Glyco_transf_41/PF13844.1/0.00031,Glyco_transf_41/PF13844.1/1.5e-26,TPR_11/PF13414.1/2.6e+02,TPR_11/PF13414.1/5.5e+03,TPR_11/PF13414.1/7.8e-08,TPR_12/PF13424.1/7.2e+03,TPR_12/PF13424.1/0.023,TPR_12/PF13424.1/0.45,TPR_2/PF07719.12/88,TPR_2/PF07719.12/1.6e+03,TPR_2/PF07719.12/1.4,TPR_2/PF07719.12/3.2,TPR_1